MEGQVPNRAELLGRGDLARSHLRLASIPISGHSCLIAMALKNSKTGSLPVSEIYSFMKEHFPYFKVRALSQGGDAIHEENKENGAIGLSWDGEAELLMHLGV